MKRNMVIVAACMSFGLLAGTVFNVSAEEISIKRKPVISLQSARIEDKAAVKLTPIQRKDPDVEIGLVSGQARVEILGLNNFQVESNGKIWKSYSAGKQISISRKGNDIVVDGKAFKVPVYLSTGNESPSFVVKGNKYRGKMKIIPSAWSNGVTVVNQIPMELYLMGVVPSEIVPSWKLDAIKAQAVAARTYAVYHRGGYRSAGYDMTDDTRSQVYRGYSVETAATNKAVEETAGEIITYNGKAIDALFHANGGGYTEDSESVWGSFVPYLRGVKEESSSVVNRTWSKTVSIDAFSNTLSREGYSVGKLKGIGLSRLRMGNNKSKDRGVSGRVKSMELIGKSGRKLVPGDVVQNALGLGSTLFDISAKGKNLIITGYGLGHGLGLSQWGAEAMAEKNGDGKDYYKKILLHYFTGSKIEKIY